MKYRAVHRFFIPSADTIGSLVVLPDDEAAHLTRVLRLKAGDSIRVFDGQGREWQADVEEVQKQQVTVRLGESVAAASEPRVGITLAVAVLKGVKMDDVVRDAVMLGVRQIVPILTERTEISASAVDRSGRISRWQRIALASVKQSGRAVVPPVMKPLGLADALDASSSGMRLMLVEPNRQAPARSLGEVAPATRVTILVGPEGGWTEHEVDLAHSAGAILATLGHQTLRADAVPVVAITAVRALWGDF